MNMIARIAMYEKGALSSFLPKIMETLTPQNQNTETMTIMALICENAMTPVGEGEMKRFCAFAELAYQLMPGEDATLRSRQALAVLAIMAGIR